MTWYFTYGSEGMDFNGGWTTVKAPDFETAEELFTSLHSSYSRAYTEDEFKKTTMYVNGNFGQRDWENIVYVGRNTHEEP